MKHLTTTLIALCITVTSSFADNNTSGTAASLKATATSNAVILNFTSAAARFEIERSFYSNAFTTIATVNMPFAATLNNFRINDTAAELGGRAIAYYRIKQISASGIVSYSNTTVVILHNNNVPIKNATVVNFTAPQNGTAIIRVKSSTGKLAETVNCIVSKGSNTVPVSKELPKGIYVAEIAVNGVVTGTQKIVAE